MSDSTKADATTSDTTPRPAKKPYKKPELIYWGNLQEMTGTIGVAGNTDNGKFTNKRTH